MLSVLAAMFLVGSIASAQETTKVLIQFESPVAASDKAFVHRLGGEINHEYSLVPGIAVEISKKALAGLERNPRIVSVAEDVEVHATALTLNDEDSATWSISNINAKPVHNGGNTGANIKIGIIDSGVSLNHPDLNVLGGVDYVQDDNIPDDVYGHGTHVAGTACGTMNGVGVLGVAPDCALYSLRVLNNDGVGYTSDILAAINWAVANDLDIVNLSLGSSRNPGSLAEQTYDAAYNSGLLIVAAAGNSGNSRGTGKNTIYPANYSSVMAVAATDSNDVRAYFSSTGDVVEIAAPGYSVFSSWNDSTSPYDPKPECNSASDCYKLASGTSMASPQVAGVAALIMAAGVSDNQEVRTILQSTATDLGGSGRDKLYGFGLVNAEAAVSGLVPPVPSDDPIANAGPDQTIEVAEGVASVVVTLDGSSSFDQNATGTIVSYEWLEGGVTIAVGEVATTSLSVGLHTITLTVVDNDGRSDVDDVVITITQYVAPAPSTKFVPGDNVKTQGVLNVRDNPDGTLIGQQPRNITGVVVGGPVYAAGYWWWEIDYEVSSIGDVDGWSVEKWLRKLK